MSVVSLGWRCSHPTNRNGDIVDLLDAFNSHPVAKVSEELAATLDFEIDTTHDLAVNITVLNPKGDVFRSVASGDNRKLTLAAGEFELWWSVGLGKQPLYTAKADLLDKVSDLLLSFKPLADHLGVTGWQRRSLDLQEVRLPPSSRRSRSSRGPGGYLLPFRGQQRPRLCWWIQLVSSRPLFFDFNADRALRRIPMDSFIINATRQRYEDWLKLLVDGNQNMIRVWAGGYYEHDDFYDIAVSPRSSFGAARLLSPFPSAGDRACGLTITSEVRRELTHLTLPSQDELGILVWQDFAFGCGAYPAYPSFVKSVRREAEANVRRIRSHPCIALYAGNNEDYQVAEQMNLEYDPNDRDGEWLMLLATRPHSRL